MLPGNSTVLSNKVLEQKRGKKENNAQHRKQLMQKRLPPGSSSSKKGHNDWPTGTKAEENVHKHENKHKLLKVSTALTR